MTSLKKLFSSITLSDVTVYASLFSQFGNLSGKEKRTMSALWHRRIFQSEDVIYLKDDVSFAIYFLVTGSVGMYDSTNFSPQSRIKLVNPNSFFGYSALFDNQFRLESVRAIEHCEVFALMRVDFLEMLKHSSRLANRILLAVSQSLLGDIRQTEEKYSSLTLQLARSNIVV